MGVAIPIPDISQCLIGLLKRCYFLPEKFLGDTNIPGIMTLALCK